jgi:transglutaminase-like putative cysteine protease
MQYDVRLRLHYDYDAEVGGGRHHLRVAPATLDGAQRVVAASLAFTPEPSERADFTDFFGNAVTAIAFRDPHDTLDVRMSARVTVSRTPAGPDVSPDIAGLRRETASALSLAPDAPHHFLAPGGYAAVDESITAYGRASDAPSQSVATVAGDLCRRIHRDFAYDRSATTVATRSGDAFRLRRGVCQDFTHVMIAALRGLGVPAGYVSGFLRTIPPPGRPRLEGADAMHAWVRVWCGAAMGWLEFDPTNGVAAGDDHITVGWGRDYFDVAPIVGILRTAGGQAAGQSVDVVPVT